MTALTCPSNEALRQYAIGDCSDEVGEEMERHLASCEACEETIAQFDSADDTLTRHLPLVPANRSPGHLESPPWLDQLRGCLPSPDTPKAASRIPVPHIVPAEGIANYVLLRVLGEGGMGVVYLARHKQLNRRVAVKVLSSRTMSSAEAQSRFLREIQLLGGLNHPGIAMATDAGTTRSGAYLVMELVDGADLATMVRRSGPLSVPHACEVARQMAEALAAAHEVSVVHRDVKPSNVMVDRQQGRVRLLDFGLARLATPLEESQDTSVGRLIGTLDYMPPEQAKGETTVDNRADLYGLGATLFFLLTGQPPHGSHAGRPLLAHLAAIAQRTPPRVSTLRADIPTELEDLLARLLESNPAQRPDSAASVAEDLARWADGDLTTRVLELPSLLDSEDETSAKVPSSQRLLSDLLDPHSSPDELDVSADKSAAITSTRRSIGKGWTWLTAIAALAATIFFGVTILLLTPEGTLRIESEADNVQVEVIDGEDRTRELRIERGINETELRAGKYRVRLAGPHDGLSLDRDVITLQNGGETVVRISRIDDGVASSGTSYQPSADETDDGQVGPLEPLYKGRRESEWRRLYETETALVPRLEAAEALLNLASALPAEQQIDRIVEIGSEIIESNYGDDSLLFALQVTHPTWGLTYRRWRGEPGSDLFKQYQSFMNQAHNQIQQLPPSVLAQRLSAEVLEGRNPRSAFAGSLLRFAAKTSIQRDAKARMTLVEEFDLPLSGINRSAIYLLIRAEYVSDEVAVRHDILNILNELIVRLNETPATEFQDALRRALLELLAERAKRYALQLNDVAIAKLVFNGGKESTLRDLLYRIDDPTPWIAEIGSSYEQSRVTDARESAAWFLDGWIPVVNEFLQTHRNAPYDTAVRYAVESLERVLRLYSDGDDWPVDTTASLLTQQLREYYADESDEATQHAPKALLPEPPAEILALVVHITGELPDFVRTGHPRPAAVRLKLQRLETLLSGATDAKQAAHEFDGLKGLLDDAPYEVVRLAFGDVALPPRTQIVARGLYVPLNPSELLYVTSRLNDDHNNRRRPPMDPLLLVAILADLTGHSEAQDERIASLFTGHSSDVTRGALNNLLSGRLKARQHARRHLEKMAATSKSQALIGAIGDLDATLVPTDLESESPSKNVSDHPNLSRKATSRVANARRTPPPPR